MNIDERTYIVTYVGGMKNGTQEYLKLPTWAVRQGHYDFAVSPQLDLSNITNAASQVSFYRIRYRLFPIDSRLTPYFPEPCLLAVYEEPPT